MRVGWFIGLFVVLDLFKIYEVFNVRWKTHPTGLVLCVGFSFV